MTRPEAVPLRWVARILLAAVLIALVLDAGSVSWLPVHVRVLRQELAGLGLFLLALPLLGAARLPPRAGVLLAVAVGTVLAASMVTGHPLSSDDDFRYIWDGKVQLAGIDPYRYPPSAPQLAHLREPLLFGGPRRPCPWPLPGGVCSYINRPTVRTIYPPVAEGAFTLIRLLSLGGRGHHVPLQLAGLMGVLAVTALLARRALRTEQPAWRVAVWAWCPVTWVELVGNAHVDWLAALLGVLAVLAYGGRRFVWAGLLLGAAVATKVYPALLGPAMLRRRPWLTIATTVGFVALVYLPHVAAVGSHVIGYLPGYLSEEHYDSGTHFLLFSGLTGHEGSVLAVLGVATAVLAVLWRADPDRPEAGALAVLGATFAITTPTQGWYAPLLLALLGLAGRVWALPVALAPTVVYLLDGDDGADAGRDALIFRAAVLAAVLIAGWEYRAQLRSWRRSRHTRTA